MRTLKFSSLLLSSTLFINCSAGPLLGNQYRKVVRTGLVDVEMAAEMVEKNLSMVDAEDQSDLLLLAGEYRRLNGDYKDARKWFQQIVEEHPTSEERNAAMLGMAVIDFESGKSQSLDTIRTAVEANVPETLNADRYRILYLVEMNKEGELAKRYLNKAAKYADAHTITKEHYHRDIGSTLATGTTAEDTTTTETDTAVVSEEERLQNIEIALSAKDWGTVIAGADAFLKDYPESEFAFRMQAYKDRATEQEPFVNNRIAVFLPFTGKYGPAAQAIQNAMKFGLDGATLDIQFYDTGWEPLPPVVFADPDKPTTEELAAKAKWDQDNLALMESIQDKERALVKKAVIEDGCGVLVGPLLTDIASSVAEAASAYGIPMLSLATTETIVENGPEIHQVQVSLDQQISALVDHAMDVKGWTTFAAMIPNNDQGKEALASFTKAVEAKNGTVLRHVEYPEKSTSFTQEARRLGLKAEVRPSEKELEKDPTLDHPTIDFEALFIPDNHRRTPLITSALAAEEFSIGNFRINRHAEPIGVLGLNKWNHPTVVKNGGQYMQNGIFVDAFWNEAPDEVTQSFVTRFETEFGKKPNIIHAVSYDAIQISKQIFNSTQTSRQSIQQSLDNSTFTQLVTGSTGFQGQQSLQREFHIMIIKSDRLEKWTPPTEE